MPARKKAAAPASRKGRGSRRSPVKSTASGVSAKHAALGKRIKETYAAAEDSYQNLYAALAEGTKEQVWKSHGHERMSDYLQDLLKCGQRNAQHLASVGRFTTKHSLDTKTLKALPPSATRELAAYDGTLNPSKKEVEAVIDRYKDEKWTVEQLRGHLKENIDTARQGSQSKSTGATGPPAKNRALRAADDTWSVILEAYEHIKAGGYIDSDSSLATAIAYAMSELSLMTKGDPKSAVAGAMHALNFFNKDMAQASKAVEVLQEEGRHDRANALTEKVVSACFVATLIAGERFAEDIEVDSQFVKRSLREMKLQRDDDHLLRNCRSVARCLMQICNVDDELIDQVVDSMTPEGGGEDEEE